MRHYTTNACGAFTAFNEVIDYLKNNNHAVLVKDCPQFRAFLLKNDGVYTLKIHYLAKDYCSAYYEKQYEFGERLTAKKIAKIEALMDEAVDNYYEPETEKEEKKNVRYKNSYREYSYYMEDGCRKMCNNSIEYDWETNSRLEFENMKASFASLSTAMSGASSNSFQAYFREVADDAMAPHPNSACFVVDNYDRELKVWIRSVREVFIEEL